MSVSRWKIMACTLGLSLGGLAICAGQPNDLPSTPVKVTVPVVQATEPPPVVVPDPVKPTLPATAPETLPPLQIPSPPAREVEFEIQSLVPAQATMPPVPQDPLVRSPIVGVKPADMYEKLPKPRDMSVPPVNVAPLDVTLPAPVADPPPAPRPPSTRPTEDTRPSPPVILPNPPLIGRDSVPLPPPMILTPPPVPLTIPQPQPPAPVAAQTTKLKMLLRLGDGKPRFEIRHSDSIEMLLKVYGEKVEMQTAPEGAKASPIAGVTAVGKVRFTGPGIEGTCDQLTVLSGTGEVLLKGNVHLKTKRGRTCNEMTTEKMIYQIGASGLTLPASNAPVRPTAYQEFR